MEHTEQTGHVPVLNREITVFFRTMLFMALRSPMDFPAAAKIVYHQMRAKQRRKRWLKQGTAVPPFMVVSVTDACNLSCKGCYALAHKREPAKELPPEKYHSLFTQAQDLGISIVILAGGEPLLRPEVLHAAGSFKKTVFALFTNGLLLTGQILDWLRNRKHIIPVISLEGDRSYTDGRRGSRTYDQIRSTLENMNAAGKFFGISVTVSRTNYQTVIQDAFVQEYVELGCRLFFFLEYVPVEENTEHATLTVEQKNNLIRTAERFNSLFPALFVNFPGDEEKFGGCLSAGRGFLHISADGGVEPCPLAPYSDVSIRDMSLKEALQSRFLRKIRDNRIMLKETRAGCALWQNREWVKSIISQEHSQNSGP